MNLNLKIINSNEKHILIKVLQERRDLVFKFSVGHNANPKFNLLASASRCKKIQKRKQKSLNVGNSLATAT